VAPRIVGGARRVLGHRHVAGGLDEAPGPADITQLDRDHPAEAAHLPARQLVLRVRR